VSEGALQELVERSRRLGGDQSLVVYGGGNTSAKGHVTDRFGHRHRVMWVKGSGADMEHAGEADYPALYLDQLVRLGGLEALDDDEVVELVDACKLVPSARRPSIETLLHALLPFTHVDHVHADAICALANHPQGDKAVREALGEGFAYVGWMRPGFALAKQVGELADRDGVVLARHGLVTWSDEAGACYRRTIDAVASAESYLDAMSSRPGPHAGRAAELTDDETTALLLALRGRLARKSRRVLRVDDRLRAVADRPDAEQVVESGVSSADHLLWLKPWSCRLDDPTDTAGARAAVDDYEARYTAYFERNGGVATAGAAMHDPLPRVLLVPGLGAVTTGVNEREARVRADVAYHTHSVAARMLDAFGPAEPMSEASIFEFDYWPQELYKLRLRPPAPAFAGSVFVVTGAASGIGREVARHLGRLGASLVVADLDGAGLETLAEQAVADGAPEPAPVVGDQTDEDVVAATVRTAVLRFGGLDGAVVNAGIGVTGALEVLTVAQFRHALDVNLTSAFLLTREAMRAMRRQGSGGSLVYVASKNAFGPGAGFGAYSVSKAGMVQLMRIAALEGGEHGIRANAVNPDAVFANSRLWSEELRAERAAAHGIDEEELEAFYARRNLLHRTVTGQDVAASVAFLLSEESSRTTGAVVAVDGGVASAFPR
jgi:rhamnulose-1-phosphate aldolase/alcohol dehydrogenase